MENRRKGQEVPCPGGPAGPLGIIRRWDLRGEGGGQGLPPPISENRCFLRVSGAIPADASGAYRPNPQAPTKLVPGHP